MNEGVRGDVGGKQGLHRTAQLHREVPPVKGGEPPGLATVAGRSRLNLFSKWCVYSETAWPAQRGGGECVMEVKGLGQRQGKTG